jgi:hypothetical protein
MNSASPPRKYPRNSCASGACVGIYILRTTIPRTRRTGSDAERGEGGGGGRGKHAGAATMDGDWCCAVLCCAVPACLSCPVPCRVWIASARAVCSCRRRRQQMDRGRDGTRWSGPTRRMVGAARGRAGGRMECSVADIGEGEVQKEMRHVMRGRARLVRGVERCGESVDDCGLGS